MKGRQEWKQCAGCGNYTAIDYSKRLCSECEKNKELKIEIRQPNSKGPKQ